MSASTEEKLVKAYSTAGGRNAAAFPWASIIELIMSLFGGCRSEAAVKRWARRNPDAAKEMIDSKLMETGMFASATDRTAAVEAAYKTLLGLSDAEIRKLRKSDDDE